MLPHIDESMHFSEDSSSKLMWAALVISFILHIATLFLKTPGLQPDPDSRAKPATISAGNMQEALKLTSPEIEQRVPEIILDETAVNIGISSAGLPTASEALSPEAMEVMEDGLQEAKDTAPDTMSEITELSAAPGLELSTATSIISLNNLLPVGDYDAVIDSNEINISFVDIPSPEAQTLEEITPGSEAKVTEEIPVITETTVIEEKNTETSLLAGITPKFKQAVRNKLIRSILSIKPEIEKRQLFGSLRFQFMVDKYGKLISSKITKSSGNKQLDKLIIKMLINNSPYPKLPPEYSGEFLRFSYPVTVRLK